MTIRRRVVAVIRPAVGSTINLRVAIESRQAETPAEAHRVVRREASFGRRRLDSCARLFVFANVRGVERDTYDLRRASRERDPLVELDELFEGGIGCPGQPSISFDPRGDKERRNAAQNRA